MQEDIKMKVRPIQKQQIKYVKLVVTILLMVATAAVPNYFKVVDAEKDQKSSDYLLPNLYEIKINSIACGDNLCNKTSTNVPINIVEKTVTVQGQKIFYLEAEEKTTKQFFCYMDILPRLTCMRI